MGLILHLVESEKIKVKNESLYVETNDKSTFVDISEFDAVIIDTTRISVTTSAILFIIQKKVPIILCNNKHMPQAFCFDIYMHYKTSERILNQVKWCNNKKEILWRKIIKEKVNGQRNNIKNLNIGFETYNNLSTYIENLEFCSFNDINAQEAVSARLYFKEMYGKSFIRHNEDIINYALNYGYSLLRSYISCLITAKGLHPSIGISHSNMFNTYNLADDIIEIFRPIVDIIVYSQIKYFDTFSKDFRMQLLDVFSKKINYKGNQMDLKRSINLFLDNIINYFDNDEELYIPRIEENYATL